MSALAASPSSSASRIGVSPKLYCPVQRFQQAVQLMHRGADIHQAERALTRGFSDQSRFANDFHAFSGLSPASYFHGEPAMGQPRPPRLTPETNAAD